MQMNTNRMGTHPLTDRYCVSTVTVCSLTTKGGIDLIKIWGF